MRFRTGIGQDSHRFLSSDANKTCVIGGLIFDDTPVLTPIQMGMLSYMPFAMRLVR